MKDSMKLPESARERALPSADGAQLEREAGPEGWSWLDNWANPLAALEEHVNGLFLQESEETLRRHETFLLPDGRRRFVKAGMRSPRGFQTAGGMLTLLVPRIRDRGAETEEPARLESRIAPSRNRVSKGARLEADDLYASGLSLAGVSRHFGNVSGGAAVGMSKSSLSRHRMASFGARFEAWSRAGITAPVAVMFADATYASVQDQARDACVLSAVGVDGEGRKSVLSLRAAKAESGAEWEAFISDLQARGMGQAPRLIVGDGGQGLWAAARKLLPGASQQICWLHASGDGARLLPRKLQAEYRAMTKAIYESHGKREAMASFLSLKERFDRVCPRAVASIGSRLDRLLTFFDFPREIWKSVYTSNPIESSFSKVKERLRRARGMHTTKTLLPMMHALFEREAKNFSPINDNGHLELLLKGALYNDGKLIKGQVFQEKIEGIY